MTGCCVPGCSNSTAKGFSMRSFPVNSERRALWIANIMISNWEPKRNSRICETHFSENMWEKTRCDGKRKLRSNAVPTIFPSYSYQQNEITLSENHNEDENDKDMNIDNLAKDRIEKDHPYQLNSDISKFRTLNNHLKSPTPVEKREESDWKKQCEQTCEELRNIMKKREELFCRIIKKSDRYRGILKIRLKKLQEDIQNYKRLKSKLGKVFNKDQIKVLGSQAQGCKWSEETIKRAIRLRFTCGSNGYQEILKQNIPLPSERTLRRKLETFKLNEEICKIKVLKF